MPRPNAPARPSNRLPYIVPIPKKHRTRYRYAKASGDSPMAETIAGLICPFGCKVMTLLEPLDRAFAHHATVDPILLLPK